MKETQVLETKRNGGREWDKDVRRD